MKQSKLTSNVGRWEELRSTESIITMKYDLVFVWKEEV